jgi:hypothetical protein
LFLIFTALALSYFTSASFSAITHLAASRKLVNTASLDEQQILKEQLGLSNILLLGPGVSG